MYQIPIAHKKCATCRWWSGRRKIIFVGANPQFISVDAMSDMKNCRAWEGRKFASTHTCFRWSKWIKIVKTRRANKKAIRVSAATAEADAKAEPSSQDERED